MLSFRHEEVISNDFSIDWMNTSRIYSVYVCTCACTVQRKVETLVLLARLQSSHRDNNFSIYYIRRTDALQYILCTYMYFAIGGTWKYVIFASWIASLHVHVCLKKFKILSYMHMYVYVKWIGKECSWSTVPVSNSNAQIV